jgi:aldose 1-epimerase
MKQIWISTLNLPCKNLSETSHLGYLKNGSEVSQFTLRNVHGMTLKLMNYGATLMSVKTPDQTELTLGFDTLEEYLKHPFYFGCTIGRVANRIAVGQFHYQNKLYSLACNENNFTHLHGGHQGFDKVLWQAQIFQAENGCGVTFSYLSPDGEENYPGNLSVKVLYFLSDENAIHISYWAQTDNATPVNLTNHTYWNLAGAGSNTILEHEMQIFADKYLETDARSLPTGKIIGVADTDFDFQTPQSIGKRIQKVGGYDHCYVVDDPKLHLAARARDPNSQRTLETYTTQPGLQFYSGNSLKNYLIAAEQMTQQWGAFCLETQGYTDAVNHANFPSILLQPGETYQHETIYKIVF